MPKRFSKRKLQVVNTKTNRSIHPQPTSFKTYNHYAVLVPFTSVFLLKLTVNTCREKERPPTTLVAILNLRVRSRGHASTNQTFFASETVQPKNNARARSGARSSCAARTRKPAQEVKVLGFCSLPARTFDTQEVENLAARSRKKLLMLPQAARRRKKY